jgi:hypothetical protein
MKFAGKGFTSDGDVEDNVSGSSYGLYSLPRIGGWVFYIPPFIVPANYLDTNEADGFGDGHYVRLGNLTCDPVATQAETSKASGSIPLSLVWVATMQVVNPYKWMFVAPRNAKAEAIKRLDAILRAWVRSGSEDDAQAGKGDGEGLWAKLTGQVVNGQPLIDWLEQEWGLRVLQNTILVRDVDYPEDYQKAMRAGKQAELQAEGDVQATAGRVMRTVAAYAGLSVEELSRILKDDQKLRGMPASKGGYKEAFAFAEDMVKRDRAADKGGLSEIRVGASDGSAMPNLQMIGGNGGIMFGGNKGKRDRGRGDRSGDDALLNTRDITSLSPEDYQRRNELLRQRKEERKNRGSEEE